VLEFRRSDTDTVLKCPEKWEEITLGRYVKFHKLYGELLAKIESEEDEDLTILQVINKHPDYFKRVVCFWLGIAEQEIDLFKFEDVITVWGAISKVLEQPAINEGCESFKYKGITYTSTENKTNHFGQRLPLSGQTFGEVVEFLQVEQTQKAVDGGDFGAIPYQIAILFRKENEVYSDEMVSERAEMFLGLSMDIVWEIAFFFQHKKKDYLTNTQVSLQALELIKVKTALLNMVGTTQ